VAPELLIATRRPAPQERGGVHVTTASEEQQWNEEQLARPVTHADHRVWLYSDAAIVLGRSQAGRYKAIPTLSRVAPVTRGSGGGAVFTGPWMMSASVVLPHGHHLISPGIVQTYRWLGAAHVRALRRLGIRSATVHPDDLPVSGEAPGSDWACFGTLAPWEVVGRGQRKIVGLAQVRRRTGVLLVAGTLVYELDCAAFASLMGHSDGDARRLASTVTSCAGEADGPVAARRIATMLDQELASQLDVT